MSNKKDKQHPLSQSALSKPKLRSPNKRLLSNIYPTPQSTDHKRSISQQVILPIIQLNQRQPTIFFQYPPVCEQVRSNHHTRPMTEEEIKKFDLTCRVFGSAPYKCVLSAFEYAGFRKVDEDDDDEVEWNVQWGVGSKSTLKNMNKYQKINHFPGCWNMGRKDLLWMNLSKFKRKYQKEFNFVPNTYLLQYDYDRFLLAQESALHNQLWIKKPCAESRGRGISMISKKSKIKKDKHSLIMEYIANPHLINGLKYDLRVYVLITSFDPLRIYLYKDGLARFATQKYNTNTKDLRKKYVHLTNFSVNKLSPNFVKNKDTPEEQENASKWSHIAYRKKLAEMNIDQKLIFNRIKDIIVKTCIASEPFMLDSNAKQADHRNAYFELYGFDVLIDERLKPWILEVNVSPSLNSSSPLDRRIKTSLVSDVLHLVGIPLWDKTQKAKPSVNHQNRQIIIKSSQGSESLSPSKFSYSRNIKEIGSINMNNCLNRLNQQDINMIVSTIEEVKRKGSNFSCIFPNPKTMSQYMDYFEFPRYNNKLIERFFQEQGMWLHKF